jgi:hypothetical protein
VPLTVSCWALLAELLIVIFADRTPVDPGANETEMEQLAPGASDDPQLLVCANSADDEVMLAIVIATDELLFLNEAARGALVSPRAVAGNESAVGLKVVGASPVPLMLMTWGLSAAESVIVIFAERMPVAAGVNVIEMEQVAPAASEDPQLLVCANSVLEETILEIERG